MERVCDRPSRLICPNESPNDGCHSVFISLLICILLVLPRPPVELVFSLNLHRTAGILVSDFPLISH